MPYILIIFILLFNTLQNTGTGAAQPAGKEIIYSAASSEDHYYFCTDGTAKTYAKYSELKNHTMLGRWNTDKNTISITWMREIGEEGIGEPIECGSGCIYSNYKPFEKTVNIPLKLDWGKIQKNRDGEWTMKDYKGSC